MKEIWKPIPGYENYMISPGNPGKVKSLSWRGSGKERLLTLQIQDDHYWVWVCKNGKHKKLYLHKAIYMIFNGDIPEGYVVHHHDGDAANNVPENLELLTPEEHARHHFLEHFDEIHGKSVKKISKPVLQIDMNENIVAEYPSTQEAYRQTGIYQGNISVVCNNGRLSTAGGFVWRYKVT